MVELADHQQRVGTDTLTQHDPPLRFIERRSHLYNIAVGDPEPLRGAVVHNNIAVTSDVVRHFFDELGKGQWNLHGLQNLLSKVLPANQVFQDFEMVQDFPGLGRRTMLLNGRLLSLGGPDRDLILLAIEDITGQAQREAELSSTELEKAIWNLSIILGRTYRETRETYDYFREAKDRQNTNNGLFRIVYSLGCLIEREVKEGEHLIVHFRPSLTDQIMHQICGKKWASAIKEKLCELGLADRVDFVLGDAGVVLHRYESLDFVLIDCEKDDYVRFLAKLRLAPGALVVADNILSHQLWDYVRRGRGL